MTGTFDLTDVEFIPQAILSVPMRYFSDRLGLKVEQLHDDLDDYDGAMFSGASFPVAIRHYAGHPNDTVTLYLPREVQELDRITNIIHSLVEDFGLGEDDIQWERRRNPEL